VPVSHSPQTDLQPRPILTDHPANSALCRGPGLTPAREEPAGLVYETPGGAWFRLYRTPYAGTAQHTIAGWEVEDIEGEVAELKARRVVFEEYHSEQFQTLDGIATTQGGRVAWFKDSEGNILGLAQTR
jgi:hypothetical protein